MSHCSQPGQHWPHLHQRSSGDVKITASGGTHFLGRWRPCTTMILTIDYQDLNIKQCPLKLESRRRRTKGSVVGEEWCQNAAPPRWYTKNVFAQSKMILSRAWLHDTVSCAAWNDARKGVYLKPLFKTPCSNCYWGWSIPIMLDYRDIPHGKCASNVGARDRVTRGNWTHDHFNWYPIHNGENSTFDPGWPPNTPYDCAEARRTQVADATFRDIWVTTSIKAILYQNHDLLTLYPSLSPNSVATLKGFLR